MSKRIPPQPSPTSVLQDAAPIPPGGKYPPVGAEQHYTDVRPLPLAEIFTGRAGRPDKVGGGEEEEAKIEDWEVRYVSGAKFYV